jgi:4'-phosphopantetheinyl transferase EntD
LYSPPPRMCTNPALPPPPAYDGGRHAIAVDTSACSTQHCGAPATTSEPTMMSEAAAAAAGSQHADIPEVRAAHKGSAAVVHMKGTMLAGRALASGMLHAYGHRSALGSMA